MLIAIEGCLGVGKSTVAKGLAAFRGSEALLEEFEKHPFLSAFYEDPQGAAIETEFAFLLLHYHQLKEHGGRIAEKEVISDFHLGKDLIYAHLNLPSADVNGVFGDLFGICARKIAAPALLILLSVSDELLIERIRRRDRDFEQKIDASYYKSVNAAYEDFFLRYKGKKIIISMDQWDFVKFPEQFERLSAMVDTELCDNG